MNARALLFALLLFGASAPLYSQDSPQAVLEGIRQSALDPSAAVALKNVSIRLGPARLEVAEGVLVPARSIPGVAAELVFIGTAQFVMEIDDPVERYQLDLFTGSERLRETVNDVVFVLPRAEVVEALLRRDRVPQGTNTDALTRAKARYAEWQESTERRMLDLEAVLLRAAMGDLPVREFVAAWCRSPRFEFLFTNDPDRLEPVRLGRFVHAELSGHEQDQADAAIRKQRRQGRATYSRVEDFGDWDTWVSMALRSGDGKPQFGGQGYDVLRYQLHAELDRNLEWLRGTTRIELKIERDGERAVSLALAPDLAVSRVRDSAGRNLFFHGFRGALTVFLNEPARAGDPQSLEISYAGSAFLKLEPGVTLLRSAGPWFPRGDRNDLATYEAVLRCPPGLQIAASGKVVDSGEDGGYRWEKRRLDVPSTSFSFEVGEYRFVEEQVGHIAVTLAYLKGTYAPDADARENIRSTTVEALKFYESTFGPYPLDVLTIATIPPRGYSQGLLSFITLTAGAAQAFEASTIDHPRAHLAHEIAHQWWGNKVVWRGDRDAWLSEALAEYSALRFIASAPDAPAGGLTAWALERKKTLQNEVRAGISVESLGPVTLGHRLYSTLSDGAYDAIVYDKGSMVFSMLSRSFGNEAFSEMLRTIADRLGGRLLDTELFLAAIERMSGSDLDAFADTFLYTTGIPNVFYEYSSEKVDEGKWKLRGSVRYFPSWTQEYRLKPTERPGWELERTISTRGSGEGFDWAVPIQMSLKGAPDPQTTTSRADPWEQMSTERGLGGTARFRIQDGIGSFELVVPAEPERVWLDQRGEVPASFFDLTADRMRAQQVLGITLSAVGDASEAEQAFRVALRAEVPQLQNERPLPSAKVFVDERPVRDAAIYLSLGKHHLDHGRDADAQNCLDTVQGLLKGPDRQRYAAWRSELQSRIDVVHGRMDAAYERLAKIDDAYVLENSADRPYLRWLRGMIGDYRHSRGEVYGLRAVSAHFTDREKQCETDRAEARARGMDVAELERLHAVAQRGALSP